MSMDKGTRGQGRGNDRAPGYPERVEDISPHVGRMVIERSGITLDTDSKPTQTHHKGHTGITIGIRDTI